MKKSILLLALSLCILLCGCKVKIAPGAVEQAASIADNQGETLPADADVPVTPKSEALPFVLNQMEYVLYQNIFFNGQADEYVDKTFTKEGIFIRLRDQWNGVDRYYVWGYMDATKCCDWQWEFIPSDPGSLPEPGSKVKMTGTLKYSDNALDKYWFVNTRVDLEESFSSKMRCDVDMSTMNATLERVQLLNVLYFPDVFEGQKVCLYGRVMNPTTIQHPYYDNAWTLPFTSSEEVPAIGTMVLITGTFQNGTVTNAHLTATSDY